jgi:hypothetical protein
MLLSELKEVKRVLGLVRKNQVCAYLGSTCDCKYGYKGTERKGGPVGEQNGCPELRTVEFLLSQMTQDEFEVIIGRNRLIGFEACWAFDPNIYTTKHCRMPKGHEGIHIYS